MEISAKELRVKPGRIIEKVLKGIDIVITYRGKKLVKIVPIETKAKQIDTANDELFGLWKEKDKNQDNTDSIDKHIRNLRMGRKF